MAIRKNISEFVTTSWPFQLSKRNMECRWDGGGGAWGHAGVVETSGTTWGSLWNVWYLDSSYFQVTWTCISTPIITKPDDDNANHVTYITLLPYSSVQYYPPLSFPVFEVETCLNISQLKFSRQLKVSDFWAICRLLSLQSRIKWKDDNDYVR